MSTAGECNDDPGGGVDSGTTNYADCEGLEELLGNDEMFEEYGMKVANDEVMEEIGATEFDTEDTSKEPVANTKPEESLKPEAVEDIVDHDI